MTYVILYVSTFVVFLALDYLGLSYIVKPIFNKHIPELILEKPRFVPALIFYAFYIGGLLWFVSLPALLDDRTLLWTFASGALIGALAYGTYEFTSLAVTKGWSWEMVIVDVSWGMCLTGASACAGVWAARTFG
jgi:uncharacterized membrane protein